MKNGHLLIRRKRADELNIERFTKPEDMTFWELGESNVQGVYEVYDKEYGEDACERENINHLSDIFGQEFHDKFFAHKEKLITRKTLRTLYVERDEINKRITKLKYL